MPEDNKRGQAIVEPSSRSADGEPPGPSGSREDKPSDTRSDKPSAATLGFVEHIPHNRALGMQVIELERAMARFKLPYDEKLVGNIDTGVLHGGAITALIDACSGASVFAALSAWSPIATLDLRIDYLRAGDPGRDITCHAHCYRMTRNVAFTRAVAYHDDVSDPIASSMGTFMLGTKPGGSAKGTPK